MRISDMVAKYISDMLEASNGKAEIQRNELAEALGCVPSQINYVITSRFTPEQGYIVESRRGGGGYIRITRIQMNQSSALMHAIHSIGNTLDTATARAMLLNLSQNHTIPDEAAALMSAALSDKSYGAVSPEKRDALRASVFKNMLITLI